MFNKIISKVKYLHSVIINGEWSYGFKGRKAWPNKLYFGAGKYYYDGNHYYLHLWKFYICVYH